MCLPFAFCGAKSCNSPPGTEALKTAIAMDRNDVEAHNGIVTGSEQPPKVDGFTAFGKVKSL